DRQPSSAPAIDIEDTGRESETSVRGSRVFREQPSAAAVNFSILGQVADSYIVFTIGKDLYIADQHALHERIRYDTIQQKNDRNRDYQYLLTPLIIRRGRADIELLQSKKHLFGEFGLEFEKFGPDAVKFDKLPPFIPADKENDIINAVLELLIENHHLKKDRLLAEITATIACRGAVMAGDHLTSGQMQDLIKTFYEKDYLNTCPHGRKFFKKITKKELDKFFDR
ncbi:MAG TPA: hypothetical protein VKS21_06615, partial [Spirochaetota bacterium]|nr:hypothetical protein [Spirochaetota bacterium]